MSFQMKRGVSQSLYKYLPDSWIDFPIRGEERFNYIAKVIRWNSEKLEDVNKDRIFRTINNSLESFAMQAGGKQAVSGFGGGLSAENCLILTPKHDSDERGIVAEISPLTFYCPKCYRVYQFKNAESYRSKRKCFDCHIELNQIRQIYFCKCGWASDKHPLFCPQCHSTTKFYWDMADFSFRCSSCKTRIPMRKTCEVCHSNCSPKVALDPSQYFPYSINLIDIIDESVEHFISKTDYGAFLSIACWLSEISRDELNKIMLHGVINDPAAYDKIFDEKYQLLLPALGEEQAKNAAKILASEACGNKYNDKINTIRNQLHTTLDSINDIAEMYLEFLYVNELHENTTLKL